MFWPCFVFLEVISYHWFKDEQATFLPRPFLHFFYSVAALVWNCQQEVLHFHHLTIDMLVTENLKNMKNWLQALRNFQITICFFNWSIRCYLLFRDLHSPSEIDPCHHFVAFYWNDKQKAIMIWSYIFFIQKYIQLKYIRKVLLTRGSEWSLVCEVSTQSYLINERTKINCYGNGSTFITSNFSS